MTYTHIIARKPAPSMVEGLRREDKGRPDYDLALKQHQAYVKTMEDLGLHVDVLDMLEEYPDSCFVEDVATVTEKMAIITNPATKERNGEKDYVVDAIKKYYPEDRIHFIDQGFVEGGDVVRAGDDFYLGISERSNQGGRDQYIEILEKYGYKGHEVPIDNGLHIGSDMMYIENNNMVMTKELAELEIFDKYNKIIVAEDEEYAANVCWINGTILVPAGYPKTKKQIEDLGYETVEIENSEFKKIDGSVTCLSLRFAALK